MPRKKKKKANKEKKVKKKCLNERESLAYEQQILDYNRELARLRSRDKELEDEVETTRQNLQKLTEDRADIVAHLKRQLESKSEETRELNERLAALEELHRDEQKSFKKKEEAMEVEFRTMESNLNAEVKLAAGKLNALEDWRLARNDLMEKFEQQENEIAEQEERHKRSLYEAEKSLVIGKAKMQKEMEQRLSELAEELRRATSIQLAQATRRTIRENVSLHEELDLLSALLRDQDYELSQLKETDRNSRLEAELLTTERNVCLAKENRQRKRIEHLARQLNALAVSFTEAQRRFERFQTVATKETDEKLERKLLSLRHELKIAKEQTDTLQRENERKEIQIKGIQTILRDAKHWILKNLQMDGSVCGMEPTRDEFLLRLKEILDAPYDFEDPLEIEKLECRYARGSLGFVPSSVEEEEGSEEKGEEESSNIEKDTKIDEATNVVRSEEDKVSCLDSEISSELTSPREESDSSVEDH